MSITTYNGNTIVEFNVDSIHGSPALAAYLLRFSISYSMPASNNSTNFFHKTVAKVYIAKNNLFVGFATPEQPLAFKPNTHQTDGSLLYEIILSEDALDEIEKIRTGKDLEFKVDISGECVDEFNQLNKSESIRYKAHQQEWIDVLKNMEYKGGIVFELPMDIEPTDEVASALIALEKAKNHLYYGNHDDVVAKCRMALESIISNWGEINTVRDLAKNNKKIMTKQQRFFNAIDQLVHFTHLAHHHDNEGEYISYTRSEAVFVLGSTISAISSYVESANASNVD